jgi:hypothetical protein
MKFWKFVFCAVLFLAGCAGSQTAGPQKEAEIPDEKVEELLKVYATVMNETYGAEADFSNPSFQDDVASYYEVKNAHTIDELEADLKQYLADGVLDRKALENDFLEKDGKLYAVRGGRGYGYYGIDPAVWERTGDSSVNVLFKILDEPQEGKQASFTFVHTADGWKIDTAVLPV